MAEAAGEGRWKRNGPTDSEYFLYLFISKILFFS